MHAPMKETEYFFSAPLEKLSFFFLPYNGIHLVYKHMLAFKGAIYALL